MATSSSMNKVILADLLSRGARVSSGPRVSSGGQSTDESFQLPCWPVMTTWLLPLRTTMLAKRPI
jgi:hypothetical protein